MPAGPPSYVEATRRTVAEHHETDTYTLPVMNQSSHTIYYVRSPREDRHHLRQRYLGSMTELRRAEIADRMADDGERVVG